MNFKNINCEHCSSSVRVLSGRKKCICSYCGRISYPNPSNFFNMSWKEAKNYCESIISENSERGFLMLEDYAYHKRSIDIWYSIYYIAREQNEASVVRCLQNILNLSRDPSNKYVRIAFLVLFEAYCFEKLGCTKNMAKAFTYLLPLAQSPYASVKNLYNIGYMYYYGEGTTANTNQALYYMRASAAKGYYYAKCFVEEHEYKERIRSISTSYTSTYTPSVPDTTEYTGYTGEIKKMHEELDDLSGSFYGTNT